MLVSLAIWSLCFLFPVRPLPVLNARPSARTQGTVAGDREDDGGRQPVVAALVNLSELIEES